MVLLVICWSLVAVVVNGRQVSPPELSTLPTDLVEKVVEPSVSPSDEPFEGRSFISTVVSVLPLLLSSRLDTAPISVSDTSDSLASATGSSGPVIPVNLGSDGGSPITELLRMLGVDSNKIGTFVVNVVVSVVEWVANQFFGGNTVESRRNKPSISESIIGLFDSSRAAGALAMAADPNLPNNLIQNLQVLTGNDTSCVQQLICKMSPFLWGVQRAFRDLLPVLTTKSGSASLPPNIGLKEILKKYVPSLGEFAVNVDVCKARFTSCNVLGFMSGR